MRILIFILLGLLGTVVKAQSLADSLRSRSDSAAFLSVGLFQQRLFSQYEQMPGQVLFHPASAYSLSTVGATQTQGDWRTPQLPEKSTVYHVTSRGVSQVKNFKVMGNFQYTRRQEDSVGWRLRPDHTDPSPYYLANRKAGNWDSHEYQLNGAAGAALTNRWSVVAGAKLLMGTYGKYNDPRPEVQRYRLQLEGGLGYKVQDISLVLTGIYGYGEDRNEVGYEDLMNRSEGRPSYTTHDIMGYGFYRVVAETEINLREDQKTYGAAAVFQFNALNVAYSFRQLERTFSREVPTDGDISPYSPIGDVEQTEHWAVGSYKWESRAVQRMVGAELKSVSVKDFNQRIIQGNNYLGVHRTANLSYHEKRKVLEYGATITYQRDSRKDGTAAVNYLVQTASVAAEAGKELPLGPGFLQVNARVAYRFDMGSSLTIGSQYNDFMRGVVLPDFTYYSSPQLEPGLSAGYGFKVKNVLLLPTFGYQLQKALSPEPFQEAAYTPSHTRSTYFVQLQVHL